MPLNASNRLNLDPPTGRAVVQFTIRPSSQAVAEGWNTQIQRAKSTNPSSSEITDVGTVPATQRIFYDRGVPSTTGGHYWRARHVRVGSTAGSWFDWVGGGPRDGAEGPIPSDLPSVQDQDDLERLSGRSSSKMEWSSTGGATIKDRTLNLSTGGNLDVDIQHGSGFRVSRHHEERKQPDGSSSVSFDNTYDSVPHTVVTPADGARVFSGPNSTIDQFHKLKTSGLDVQGFDELIGEIVTSSQTTSVVDGFSSTQNTGSPENSDVTLTADGETAFSNLEDANKTPVDYDVYFDWDASNLSIGDSVTLHVEVNNSSGGTSWTEKASYSLVPGNSGNNQSLTFNEGLDANYDIRARASADSGLPSWSITMHGEDNTQPGVQYDKDTGTATVGMSPSTGDKLLWQAEDTA